MGDDANAANCGFASATPYTGKYSSVGVANASGTCTVTATMNASASPLITAKTIIMKWDANNGFVTQQSSTGGTVLPKFLPNSWK